MLRFQLYSMSKIKVNKKKMNELIETADNKREWHPNFLNYTEFISSHNNYKGLYFERGADNRIKWVVLGKSTKGQERRLWWDEECKKFGIDIKAGCYAKIALKLHPTKIHICQICGRELSIRYIYPSKRTIKNITKEFGVTYKPFEKDIFQIIDEIVITLDDVEKFKHVFKIKHSIQLNVSTLKDFIEINFVDEFSKSLSPGVFSNSPDRFDGYHSDGNCCRSKSDKGRHSSNMNRYGQDRRVYENWADGDWKMADRLMSLFRNYGMSADHIGPISLGFCHRPKFHPLTNGENSAKNNRMSLNDVKVLIEDEKTEQVVSWHSKFIWDKLKNKVGTDEDAKKLSDLMRKNMHHVLIIFSMIDELGYGNFLEQFLNPEYSFFDYKFEGFEETTGSYKKVVSKKLLGKNQRNNIERYYRIAFDKLKEYRIVDNRKVNKWESSKIDEELKILFELLKENRISESKIKLETIFSLLADLAENNW